MRSATPAIQGGGQANQKSLDADGRDITSVEAEMLDGKCCEDGRRFRLCVIPLALTQVDDF